MPWPGPDGGRSRERSPFPRPCPAILPRPGSGRSRSRPAGLPQGALKGLCRGGSCALREPRLTLRCLPALPARPARPKCPQGPAAAATRAPASIPAALGSGASPGASSTISLLQSTRTAAAAALREAEPLELPGASRPAGPTLALLCCCPGLSASGCWVPKTKAPDSAVASAPPAPCCAASRGPRRVWGAPSSP